MPKKNLRDHTTREIIAFSLLPFGLLTIQTLINTALNMYLTDVLGLTLAMTGVVLSATKVWDAVNDPMMGLIVDRTRTKRGKCRPYILWTVIPVVLTTSMLFFPVHFGQKGNFAYAIIAYLLYYTAYTALDIPYQGLTPLVFPESKKRVKAISVSNIVGSIGTILPSVLFFTIAGLWGNQTVEQEKTGYFMAALIFSVMAGIFIASSYFGIKEKVYVKPEKTNYIKGLKIVFSDKKMVILVVVAFFSAIANLGAMFLPYFAKWNCIGVLPMDQITGFLNNLIYKLIHVEVNINLTNEGLLTPLLQIGSGISYMLSMAIIPPLLKKMSKKTLWIWMSLLGAVADILTFIIGMYVIPYNTPAGLVTYIVLRFFTNFPVGMTVVLLIAMFSDLVDNLEMKSGERLEGTVFSFRSLINKISIALFNVIVLAIVNGFGYMVGDKITSGGGLMLGMTSMSQNYTVPLTGTHYETVLTAIFFMLTGLGAIGLILQALPMFFYKFDEKKFEKEIASFREEKEKKLQAEIEAAEALEGVEFEG